MKTLHSLPGTNICHWCGKAIDTDKLLLRDGKSFCCEVCYRGVLAVKNNHHATNEAYLALAECFVAALNAREMVKMKYYMQPDF